MCSSDLQFAATDARDFARLKIRREASVDLVQAFEGGADRDLRTIRLDLSHRDRGNRSHQLAMRSVQARFERKVVDGHLSTERVRRHADQLACEIADCRLWE